MYTSVSSRSSLFFYTQREWGHTHPQHIPYHNVTLHSRYSIAYRTNPGRQEDGPSNSQRLDTKSSLQSYTFELQYVFTLSVYRCGRGH